jgi:hypothetical protein
VPHSLFASPPLPLFLLQINRLTAHNERIVEVFIYFRFMIVCLLSHEVKLHHTIQHTYAYSFFFHFSPPICMCQCILLYTLDETIFPQASPRPSSDATHNKTVKSPPPLTYLKRGPRGAGHRVVPEWRGEPLRPKFEAAVPRIHECPPTGMGTPFGDLQQLSVFAFPKVLLKKPFFATYGILFSVSILHVLMKSSVLDNFSL